MAHKGNAIGFRLGYTSGWQSNWFASKRKFADRLLEDDKIRKYIEARTPKAGVAEIVIERTLKKVVLIIHTSRPGFLIGKAGVEVEKIRQEIKKLTEKEVSIDVVEVKKPELNARLVADSIAHQLKARGSHKKIMKTVIASTTKAGAQGIKVRVSGRLGGIEIARSEEYKEGRVPLHTLRANIDYACVGANTIYGVIGVKVWIFKGEVFGKTERTAESLSYSNNKFDVKSEKLFQKSDSTQQKFKKREGFHKSGTDGKPNFSNKAGTGSKPGFNNKSGTGSKPNFNNKSGTGNKPKFNNKSGTGSKPNFVDKKHYIKPDGAVNKPVRTDEGKVQPKVKE